ncbi:MAG: tail assembly chaperone [Clostridia bacterium]|nr:tail assembly chaperone [Clostridia bacterium]MBO7151005.1 tail assembly chaperone [Clostridia bacterium]
MFELTINGKVYSFKFGMGFLRELDPTVTKPVEGVKGKEQHLGVQYAVAGIIDGDVVTLADVLVRANKGFDPRVTQKEIESYIEDENTDIDALFADVLGFLRNANATKKITANLLEAVEAEKAKAEKANA